MNAGNSNVGLAKQVMVALFVVSGLVGAGVLALPVNTGLAGFVPSITALFIYGSCMFFTATVLAGESITRKNDTFNYPSLYREYFGVTGKWAAVAVNLFLLYGLTVAYVTGGSEILSSIFDVPVRYHKWVSLAFSAVLILIITRGMTVAVKFNTVFTLIVFSTFVVIVLMATGRVKMENLAHRDWLFLPCAVPIVVAAFNFHNIIPSVCRELGYSRGLILRTIFLGMVTGLFIYVVWMVVGIGSLPLTNGETSLVYAFENNLPATIPLSVLMSSKVFLLFALIFSMVALTASCIANCTGLLAFVEDLSVNTLGIRSGKVNALIAFVPPVLISIVYPDIFLVALNLASGFGIVVLFGVMPGIIAILKTSGVRRLISVIVFSLFLGAFVFEIFQETGMLRVHPHIEYDLPQHLTID